MHVRAREGSCVGVRVIVAVLQCTHLKFFLDDETRLQR